MKRLSTCIQDLNKVLFLSTSHFSINLLIVQLKDTTLIKTELVYFVERVLPFSTYLSLGVVYIHRYVYITGFICVNISPRNLNKSKTSLSSCSETGMVKSCSFPTDYYYYYYFPRCALLDQWQGPSSSYRHSAPPLHALYN